MKWLPILLYLILSLTTGCATQISPEILVNADYGPPPPLNHKELIQTNINQRLIDPTSALYEFATPAKGYTKASTMFGTPQAFGWRVCGNVNSKNRFGGYVGRVPFFVLFQDGNISQVHIGKITDNAYGINFHNSAIQDACQRSAG